MQRLVFDYVTLNQLYCINDNAWQYMHDNAVSQLHKIWHKKGILLDPACLTIVFITGASD